MQEVVIFFLKFFWDICFRRLLFEISLTECKILKCIVFKDSYSHFYCVLLLILLPIMCTFHSAGLCREIAKIVDCTADWLNSILCFSASCTCLSLSCPFVYELRHSHVCHTHKIQYKKNRPSLRWADRTDCIHRPALAKITIFQRNYSLIQAIVTLLYWTLQSTLDSLSHVNDGCKQKLLTQTAADKDMATIDIAAYRNLLWFCPITVPSFTPLRRTV